MKTKITKKIMSGLAVGCLLLSLGGLVAAQEVSADQPPAPCVSAQFDRPSPADMEQHISAALGKLVEQQTITQEQSDKILAFFKEKELQRKAEFEKVKAMSPEERKTYFEQRPHERHDLVNDLAVSAGLSADQAKTVADALRPPRGPHPEGPRHANMEQAIHNGLNNLVEKRTISQDQADKVLSFFKEKELQHKTDFEKMKAMNPEERKAYFAQRPHDRPDIVKDLMAAAGLSSEQAQAVADMMRPPHGPHGPNPEGPCPPPNMDNNMAQQ